MGLRFIKRRYFDGRIGYTLIAPLFAVNNFVLIAYNFTDLKNIIPFDFFVLFFILSSVVVLVFLGNTFRNKQLSIDVDLSYEKSPQQATTNRIILEQIQKIQFQNNLVISKELKDRIDYLRNIESVNAKIIGDI